LRANKVREIWSAGGAVVNGWLAIANSFSAEVMAHEDFDSLTVDMQHGMVDFQPAIGMLQAISTRDVAPLARVPWNEPAFIMKILDAGAYGIVCPMINTRADCEKFVGACRYAPAGYRSFGPPRGLLYGGGDYAKHANATIIAMGMIETREAVANLDEIMTVDGLDGIYIGPNDLAISLGFPPNPEPVEPEVREAVETILAAAKRHGVQAGIHCPNGSSARHKIEMGFTFVTLGNDARMLATAAKDDIKTARGS